MSGQPPRDFVYVHTDIPDGMTIGEWRAHQAAERAVEQRASAEERRQRSARRGLCATTRAWLVALRTPRGARAREAGA